MSVYQCSLLMEVGKKWEKWFFFKVNFFFLFSNSSTPIPPKLVNYVKKSKKIAKIERFGIILIFHYHELLNEKSHLHIQVISVPLKNCTDLHGIELVYYWSLMSELSFNVWFSPDKSRQRWFFHPKKKFWVSSPGPKSGLHTTLFRTPQNWTKTNLSHKDNGGFRYKAFLFTIRGSAMSTSFCGVALNVWPYTTQIIKIKWMFRAMKDLLSSKESQNRWNCIWKSIWKGFNLRLWPTL